MLSTYHMAMSIEDTQYKWLEYPVTLHCIHMCITVTRTSVFLLQLTCETQISGLDTKMCGI